MRFLVAASFFDASASYIEAAVTRALVSAGHDVVVYAAKIGKPIEGRFSGGGSVDMVHVKELLRFKNTFVRYAPLSRYLAGREFDGAIVFAPNHGFTYYMARALPRTLPLAVFFGDLRRDDPDSVGAANQWIMKHIKWRWYRWLAKRATALLSVTPETKEIVDGVWGPQFAAKSQVMGLPYEANLFYRDPIATSSPLLTTVTRVFPQKPVGRWINYVGGFLESHPNWKYCFAGFDQSEHSQKLRAYLATTSIAGQLELVDRLDAQGINTLYNRSQLGIWFTAAISIQQALATGLPVVIPNMKTVSHLVSDRENGCYFDSPNQISEVLCKAAAIGWDREAISRGSLRFSAEATIPQIIQAMGLSTSPAGPTP